MTKTILLIFALLLVTLFSCTTNFSDRIHPLDNKKLDITVDTFQIHKKVTIELETIGNFNFGNNKILILINSSDIVFYGTYPELIKTKIPLPEPNEYSRNKSGYLVAVAIYDLRNKIEYKWGSDESNYFDENKKNKIKLLYTGIPEESITLKVEQIE